MAVSLRSMLLEAEAACRARGLPGLRPLQAETLTGLAEGRSVFAGLPTGYGKSLCYWLPAVAWEWRVWVLSPLVSLIEDQALACREMGVAALAWHGALDKDERDSLESEMAGGRWQVCLLSPERYVSWAQSGYLKALEGAGLDADLLVLDEMHCLEEWRDFRAAYASLVDHVHRGALRGARVLGLSASLPDRESRAWMEELCGEYEYRIVQGGLGRPNLSLRVLPLEEEPIRWEMTISALRELRAPASALVYCYSREETDELARWLRSAGLPAVAYHAGLPREERRARTKAFREGRLRIVCATSAFGMGIDYGRVDLVIHFSMPRDLESYWQEVGRAGRAGQEAKGLAFWRRSEVARARILQAGDREKFLALWLAWARGGCRKAAVAQYLGHAADLCGRCDRCLPLEEDPPLAWWARPESCLESWARYRFAKASFVKRNELQSHEGKLFPDRP